MENLYPQYMADLRNKMLETLSLEYDRRELGDNNRNHAFQIIRQSVDRAVDSVSGRFEAVSEYLKRKENGYGYERMLFPIAAGETSALGNH